MTLRIVILGLSITSSWGNGHATIYRGLVRALARLGHDVLFLERDKPWYGAHRDQAPLPFGSTCLYDSLDDLKARFAREIRTADCVIVGSYVPEGIEVGKWVTQIAEGITAFYDIDTPVTQAKMARGECDYLSPELVAKYAVYLSFTGGPILREIERLYGSPEARAFYCCVDPQHYFPERSAREFDLGHLGTFSPDRHPALERLLLAPARKASTRRFTVAGSLYPETMRWPSNVRKIDHLPPARHRAFYNSQRYTLNITRRDMVRSGYSPSVRVFEAAACGVPIITDDWPGLEEFFEPGREILVARSGKEVLEYLNDLEPPEAQAIAARARQRVLNQHTAAHRAGELETMILMALAPTQRIAQ